MSATEETRGISDYSESMRTLRDSIAPLAAFLGIATARNLIIQKWGENEEIIEIFPRPIMGRKQPQIVNADNSNIGAKQDLLVVEGITRAYPREKIIGTGINYWIDSELTSSGITGGFQAEFISVEEMPLTWNLTLRRVLNERRGV